MATTLPDDIGTGLDPDVATVISDGRTVPASEALTFGAPSPEMRAYARAIVEWLTERGCVNVDCVADDKADSTRPGGLMIRWGDPRPHTTSGPPVPAAVVAAEFGPIPVWLSLRRDGLDYDDLPWVPAF